MMSEGDIRDKISSLNGDLKSLQERIHQEKVYSFFRLGRAKVKRVWEKERSWNDDRKAQKREVRVSKQNKI